MKHRYEQLFRVQVGNGRELSPSFTTNKLKKKLSFKIICSKEN